MLLCHALGSNSQTLIVMRGKYYCQNNGVNWYSGRTRRKYVIRALRKIGLKTISKGK